MIFCNFEGNSDTSYHLLRGANYYAMQKLFSAEMRAIRGCEIKE
jgi:hypothetical protein